MSVVQELADTLVLGSLLDDVRARLGGYEFIDHWTQGEFHHDVVLRTTWGAPGRVLVVATNCNGGVKEVLSFDEVPPRSALWHWRCPQMPEFSGDLPTVRDRAITTHWFDPCQLLLPNARSEMKAEHRTRQLGGGWEMKPSTAGDNVTRRVTETSMWWCDDGAVVKWESSEEPDAVTAAALSRMRQASQVAVCHVDARVVVVLNALSPALTALQTQARAGVLSSHFPEGVLCMWQGDGAGWATIDVLDADDSSKEAAAVATVHVKVHWAWDESDHFLVTANGRQILLSRQWHEGGGWDIEWHPRENAAKCP